ncbi:hypothetical protein ScPMuIL_012710 [Solemya velum]
MATVVMTQPPPGGKNSEGLLVTSVQGHRNWTTGLFDCFSNCKTCVVTTFCLPLTVCNISRKLGDNACMPFFVQGSQIAMRSRIRTLGGIQGTICNDCLVISWCGPCAVCQMSRELENMGL